MRKNASKASVRAGRLKQFGATLAAYVVSLLYLARRPVHQNLTNRWSRRMKLDTADDVNLDDTSWNNDELLPDPDRPAVYSL